MLFQDKMEGEVVQINRLLVVDQQYRQSGLGTFLIRHSIEDALRSGCAAYFYPACGGNFVEYFRCKL